MTGSDRRLIESLLSSEEPSIRWKIRTGVLGEDPSSARIRRLREEIRDSTTVKTLLDGQARVTRGTYAKWQGRHWVLAALADLGYPQGDLALAPIVEKMLSTWLDPKYFREMVPDSSDVGHSPSAVARINGRYRRCASQQGSALLSVVRLGIAEQDAPRLVERLLHWQWPDGGWNCAAKPEARSSSVYETLLPMRGLAAYARAVEDAVAMEAARKAAEVFLGRRVLFRRTDGRLIRREWAELHYPVYWHYDVLAGLKGLMEVGLIADERTQAALDLLESRRLPEGGWPADARFARSVGEGQGQELLEWGPAGSAVMNEWVSADALAVLHAAGR